MVRISVLGDALKTMYNAEKRGKVSRGRWENMGSAVVSAAGCCFMAPVFGLR